MVETMIPCIKLCNIVVAYITILNFLWGLIFTRHQNPLQQELWTDFIHGEDKLSLSGLLLTLNMLNCVGYMIKKKV